MRKKQWARPALVAGLVLTLAVPIAGAGAADHLDSPAAGDVQTDINDLYAFEGSDPTNTVLAVTVAPAAGVIAGTNFAHKDVAGYQLRVDNDGDTIEDVTFQFDFIDRGPNKPQMVQVRMATGDDATSLEPEGRLVARGDVGTTLALRNGGKVFTGLRSDPFFFDFTGFLGTVEGVGDDAFGDNPTDFFAGLNTLAIVIEVPDEVLGGEIAVWATTSAPNADGVWQQADRMGRPAINTVVNSTGPIVQAPSGNKALFNASHPKDDAQFIPAAAAALTAFSSLDAEGAYTQDQLLALAGVLLPDVLRYDTATEAVGPLNGRALDDDVIDIELRIVTGGDPLGLFADRDADGAINSDGVGPHTDYLPVFPYLGNPHS